MNGSVSSVNFTLISNVSCASADVSLRVRTRQSSAVLIEVRSNSSRFFKMELTDGRVQVTFALEGESGLIMSGRMIGVEEKSYFKIITEIPIEELKRPATPCGWLTDRGLKAGRLFKIDELQMTCQYEKKSGSELGLGHDRPFRLANCSKKIEFVTKFLILEMN